jgi:ATP-dependent DNA ligase
MPLQSSVPRLAQHLAQPGSGKIAPPTAPAGSTKRSTTDGHARGVRLISRQAVDHTDRFRELAGAIAALRRPPWSDDGEVCVFDKIISQFQLLDRGATDEHAPHPSFMAFGCLHVHGVNVRGLPLHHRRQMLERSRRG